MRKKHKRKSGSKWLAVAAVALLAAGADCLTLGDHAFDQKDMLPFIEQENRILRPLNFARLAPGKGARVFSDARGRKVLVAQVLGQVFMKRPFDDPFSAIDTVLKVHTLGGAVELKVPADSEAGRKLFAISRQERKVANDADRLRKYLARFGLEWATIKRQSFKLSMP